MLLEKQVLIEAPIGRVWETLMDIPFVASCMAGVEELEAVDANSYRCVAKGKIAYLSATFDMLVTIAEKREPVRLRIAAEGKERHGLARLRQEQTLDLRALSDSETEVKYQLELVVIGKLASLGQKAIVAKVDEMAESFLKPFAARCKAPGIAHLQLEGAGGPFR